MRITDSSMQAAMLRRIQQGYGQMARASEAIASGRRIRTGADDPVTAADLRRVEAERAALAAGIERAQGVTGSLQAAEAALGEGSETLLRAYELAIQTGNGSYDATSRAAAAAEVRQIKEALLSIANAQFDGKYMFGGLAEDRAPFDPTGASTGAGGAREVEVLSGLRVEATVTGDAAFAGGAGGVDVFAALDALATALEANDTAPLPALAEDLETARDQLTALRADLGARLNLVARTTAFAERMQDSLAARQRDVIDTDIAAVATELSQAETTLQAAISVSRRLMDPTALRMLM